MFNVWTKIKELINRPYIVESGSNTNGSYTKWSNGDMICTLNIIVTDQAISNAYGTNLFQGTRKWVYPAEFVTLSGITCSLFQWGNSASWGTVTGEAGPKYAYLRGIDITSRAAGTSTKISAIAIGKWK